MREQPGATSASSRPEMLHHTLHFQHQHFHSAFSRAHSPLPPRSPSLRAAQLPRDAIPTWWGRTSESLSLSSAAAAYPLRASWAAETWREATRSDEVRRRADILLLRKSAFGAGEGLGGEYALEGEERGELDSDDGPLDDLKLRRQRQRASEPASTHPRARQASQPVAVRRRFRKPEGPGCGSRVGSEREG